MRVSIASPPMQPSLNGRRVGIRIVTFDLLRLHSRYGPPVAQPLKAAFVTRLQPCRLPGRTVRQLPDQSTTLWVESSSTSDPRLRSALPNPTLKSASLTHIRCRIPASLRATATIAHNMLDRLTIRRPRARNTDHFLTRSRGLAAASHSASRTATRSKIHSAEVRSGVASFGSGLAVYGLELPTANLGEISLEEEVEQSSNHCDGRKAHQLVPARSD
jgi:hypothetical protein